MNEKELIQNIAAEGLRRYGTANETGVEIEIAEKIFNASIQQIVASLKNCESVTIRNFGCFYIRPSDSSTKVFKFSPSQRLRKLFGWSWTYKGEV